MADKAVIFGTGGQSRVVRSLLPDGYLDVIHVNSDGAGADIDEQELFGRLDSFGNHDFYVAIGDNKARRRIFTQLHDAGMNLPPLVAPNAYISPHARLGRGVFVGVGACLVANAEMRDNSILNTNSSLDHDCVLDHSGQIAVGVSVAGECYLGENCFVGMQAGIVPRISIGNNAVIMAGAMVTRDVEADSRVGGIPARVMK